MLLAREGAKVIAADRNLETAKETVGKITNEDNSHMCLKLTVNEPESVHGALAKIIDVYKRPPNVIVNCAGITRDNFALKLSLEDFNEVVDVNLKVTHLTVFGQNMKLHFQGTFLILQTFAGALVQREIKNGSIINISSIVGKYGNLGQTNYCASKAGVELLTKTAAKELGKFGIRVNFVRPGFIESPMTETVPENVKQKFIANIPFRRFGKPHGKK